MLNFASFAPLSCRGGPVTRPMAVFRLNNTLKNHTMTTQDTSQQETPPNDMSAEGMDVKKVGAGNTAAIDAAEVTNAVTNAVANAPSLRYRVKLTQTSEVYDCMPEESMLQGMARLGRRGIPLGCLNGGCGICKVAVVSGEWQKTGLMSRAHVSEEEEARGVVLACRAAPGSDVEIDVLGKMQKSVFKGWGQH